MNGLHITLTDCKYESRLLKETETIADSYIVSNVYIAALWEKGLNEKERFDSKRYLWRIPLRSRNLGGGIFFQSIKYGELLFRIFNYYKQKKIQFISCHSVALLPIGVLLKLLWKSKLIYDAHELETESAGLSGIRKKFVKLMESFLIRSVDLTIVVSLSIAKKYTEFYPELTPLVIYNYPKLFEIHGDNNKFRKKFAIHDDQKIFLYQGGLSKGRGIEYLLEAFKELNKNKVRNAVFVVMGYGSLREKIIEYSKACKNIFYHAAVAPQELLAYTSSADFGFCLIENCCLSYYLCMPNKLFEYLMAEVPVVVSNLPEMKRIVIEYKVGLVIENTKHEILKSINQLAKDNGRKYRSNLKKMKHQISWETQQQKMIEAYQKILSPNL